jgi:ABC-2 type transport system permease protein
MTTRQVDRPLSLIAGARLVLDVTLAGRAWIRRSVVPGILLGLPVLLGTLGRIFGSAHSGASPGPQDAFARVMALYYLGVALPLVALFAAGPLVAEEVESRTITYLVTRPIARASILLGKFAAFAVVASALAVAAVTVAFFIIVTRTGFAAVGAQAPTLARALLASVLALFAYGALFALVGILFRRPLVLGILLFAWDGLAHAFGPGALPQLTLTAHLRAILDAGGPLGQSLGILLACTLAFLGLAVVVSARREYVPGE